MNVSEWLQIGTAIAVMMAAAAAMVWWSPEASAYASRVLLARAMALREARRTYREIFDEHMNEGRERAPGAAMKAIERARWIRALWAAAGLVVVVLILRRIG